MFHLIGADDRLRAARYYTGCVGSGSEVFGATQALARHILATEDEEPKPGLQWVLSLLDQPGLSDDELGGLCTAFSSVLDLSLMDWARLDTRATFVQARMRVLNALVRQEPDRAAWESALCESQGALGQLLLAEGDPPGAREWFGAALRTASRMRCGDQLDERFRRVALAENHLGLGGVLRAQDDLAGALAAYREGAAVLASAAEPEASAPTLQSTLSVAQGCIGNVLLDLGDMSGALAAYRAALEPAERLAAQAPGDAARQVAVVEGHATIGTCLLRQGDLRGALGSQQTALAAAEQAVAQHPTSASCLRALAGVHEKLGTVLLESRLPSRALDHFRASLAIDERLAAHDPGNTRRQEDLALSYNKLGDALLMQGDAAGAAESSRREVAVWQRLTESDRENANWRRELATALCFLGGALQAEGDSSGALGAFQQYSASMEELVERDPENALWQRDLAVAYYQLGLLHQTGDRHEAARCLLRCREVLRSMLARGMHLDAQASQVLEQLEQALG
jgi:tetratricopeptide (TPR) repeat protein